MISDVLVNFNSVTKEITCAGIKISNIKTCPVKLTKINSLITQIEENIFIKFNDTKCKVSTFYKTYQFLLHRIYSVVYIQKT